MKSTPNATGAVTKKKRGSQIPKGKTDKAKRRLQHFANEYVVDMNGIRAAIAAGISPKSAGTWASRALKNSIVRKFVEDAQAKACASSNVNAERVLLELARVAFSNMDDFVNREDGEVFVDLSIANRAQMASISSIESDTYVDGRYEGAPRVKRLKLRVYDKVKALSLLGEHLKLFRPTVGSGAFESLAQMIGEAHERERRINQANSGN